MLVTLTRKRRKQFFVDSFGNCYITGNTEESETLFDSLLVHYPGFFIAKYDSSGNVKRAKGYGGNTRAHSTAITMDGAGNLFIAGDFSLSPISLDGIVLSPHSLSYGTIYFAKFGSTTGTEIISNDTRDLDFHPNPVKSQLTITCANKIMTTAVTDIMGQTVYTQNHKSKQVQVDVSGLAAGVYFVKINGVEVRRFVKE